VEISEKARKAIEETILEHSMKYQEVITWSTDGFFRETKEKVAYRKRNVLLWRPVLISEGQPGV